MKSSTSKRSWLIMGAAGITISTALAFAVITSPLAQGSYQKTVLPASSQAKKSAIKNKLEIVKKAAVASRQASLTLPVQIQIPKINITATLESVGLTPDGAVDVPKTPANAAWFNMGPRPGEKGSAVIVGHYGRWKNGDGSVFDNINILKKGDKLYVKDAKGMMVTFIVKETKKYDPDATAVDVFNSNDGKSHLNLITCEGTWNKISKSYSKRLVVFADKQ